jgi:hypothetical protein
VAVLLLLAALGCLVAGVSLPPGTAMVLLYVAAAILAAAGAVLLALAASYRQLSYALTEQALRIKWLGRTVIVPYSAIQGIYAGQRLSGNSTPDVPGWPGINVGPRRVRGMGRLRFFATSSDQSLLTLITVEHGGVIVSAEDPTEFQTALISHVEQYEDHAVEPTPAAVQQRGPVAMPWTALADLWLPVCLAIGIVLLLVTLAAISQRYDALPDQIPLHFDASLQTSQIAPKSDLLRLPLLGLICLAINGGLGVVVHPRERTLARLLWLGGAIVQMVLLIGLLRLLA